MFKSKIKLFDAHHVFERQTLWTGLSVLLLTSSFAISKIHSDNVLHKMQMKINSTGSTSTFSKSNTVATLGETHLSYDGKTAFIPLSFDSVAKLGTSGDDFRLYLGNVDMSKMQQRFTAHLIMYGTSGRAVIVLQSDKQITNKPLDLFVMNLAKLTTISSQNDADSDMESNASTTNSSSKYDMINFTINPGATDVLRAKRISANATDAGAVYQQMFTQNDMKRINNAIASDKKKLKTNYAAASNYLSKIDATNQYKVTDSPEFLANSWQPDDAVNLSTGKTKAGKDALKVLGDSNSTDSDSDDSSSSDSNSSSSSETYGKIWQKSSNGWTNITSQLDGNSDSDSGSDDSNDSSSDGAVSTQTVATQNWTNLQTAWNNIYNYKYDMYVTQPLQILQLRKLNNSTIQQASVGNNKLIQLGGVDEND